MEEQSLNNWLNLLYSEEIANKYIALAMIENFTAHKGIWPILAMVYRRLQSVTKKRYQTPVQEEEQLLAQLQQTLITYKGKTVAEGLIGAAAIIDITATNPIGIGNADAYGYEQDCQVYWQDFEPYKDDFEAALSLSAVWVEDWLLLGQILWAHFRWVEDDDHGCFSLEAASYFLAKAVTLQPTRPIHYYTFWEIAPSSLYKEEKAKYATLQSTLGVNYYYYAQLLHYHKKDYAQARAYYRQFIQAEPTLIPDNHYELYFTDKQKRMYPPCVQEAYTEIARTYKQEGDLQKSIQYYKKAIALRPDNHRAPYEGLAAIHEQEGNLQETFTYYMKKLSVCMNTTFKKFLYSYAEHPLYYFHYDPTKKESIVLSGRDRYKHMQVVWFIDLAKKIADMALFELENYEEAQKCYKICEWFLQEQSLRSRRPYRSAETSEKLQVSIWENQAIVALEMKDFWQARTLYEKIIKRYPSHKQARRGIQQISNYLGY